MSAVAAVAVPSSPAVSTEGSRAARHAVTLGLSLAATLAVAVVVRLCVPRVLGPDSFGALRWAESAAEMVFVVLTFGVDTHLRREAALDADRAHGLLGGLLVTRLIAGVVLIAAIAEAFVLRGVPVASTRVFLLIAGAEVCVVTSNSIAAIAHATGAVSWVARTTVLFKVLWAVVALLALRGAPSALTFGAAMLVAEAARALWMVAHPAFRHVLRTRPAFGPALTAIAASTPYFVNFVAHNIYGRLGVWTVATVAGDRAVGWFGAASGLAAIALLGMPLLSWVLVPSTTRAAQESDEALAALTNGTLRAALLCTAPVIAAAMLAAPLWTRMFFGASYAPAATALAWLAPTFGLAYVSTIAAIDLIQRNRIRALATVSVAGIGVSFACNAALVRAGFAHADAAGAANGAAIATLLTEGITTALLLALGARAWWSRETTRTVVALAAAGGVAFAVAHAVWLRDAAPAVALLAFCAVAWGGGAWTPGDTAFCRQLVAARGRVADAA